MKFNTNRLRAFYGSLLILTSTSTTNVLAKPDHTDGTKKL